MKSVAQKQAQSQAQKARRREHVVKKALKKGKHYASLAYGEPLSNVKRWCNRYDPAKVGSL